MKKILAIFLAVMMALALVVTPAMAVNGDTVDIFAYSDNINAVGGIYNSGLATLFAGEKATLFVVATDTNQGFGRASLTTNQTPANGSVITYEAASQLNTPASATVATITAVGAGLATATTNITTASSHPVASSTHLSGILVKAAPVLKSNGTSVPSVMNLISNANFDRSVDFTLEGTKNIGRDYSVNFLANQPNATMSSLHPGDSAPNTTLALTAATNTDSGFKIIVPKNTSGLITVAVSFTKPAGNGSVIPLNDIIFSINVSKSGGVPFTSLTIKDKAKLPPVVGVDSEISLAGSGAPTNGDEKVYWISNNPAALVFKTGNSTTAVYEGSIDDKPTAVAIGKGNVTVTLQNLAANVKDTYAVNILDKAKPTDIVITNTNPTISSKLGELDLKAQVYPVNANQTVTWSIVAPSNFSSLSGWALDADTGELTSTGAAVDIPGDIIIAQASTVEYGSDGKARTATVQISVKEHVAAASVVVDSLLAEVAVSGKLNMSAVVWNTGKTAEASNQAVTWSVSDTSLATIDSSGVLTGVKAGTVKVFAASNEDASIVGEKTIKVVEELTTDVWFVTSAELAVRARADSTSAKLGTLKKADRVSYVSDNGVWAQIEYNGAEAYVARAHIAKAPTYAVSSFTLKVRSTKGAGKPEVDSNVVAVAKCAEEFVLLDEGTDGWAKVIYNNMLCFMFSNGGKNIKLSPLTASITSNTLKVRAAADGTSAQIGELVKGETFTITGNTTVVVDGRNINWYHINYGGTTAYVSSTYVAIN